MQQAGRTDDAAWQAEEIKSINPDFSGSEMLQTYPMEDVQQIARLTDALGALGL